MKPSKHPKCRKLKTTPRSRVRAAIRALWLRSRERAAALKRESNTCECCGAKQSVAKGREVKLQVHHLDGIEWEKVIDYVFRHVLVDPDKLQVLCESCHNEEHQL